MKTDNELLIEAWNKCVDSMRKSVKKSWKPKQVWFDTGTEYHYINIEKNGKKGEIEIL